MRIGKICIECRLLHEKWKPHRKNGQIMTNDKHFKVENVLPICQPYARAEEVKYFKTFSKNINHSSSVIFTEDFDFKKYKFLVY